MKEKILITGSTGFVGRHLVPELLNKGYQILEITRNIEKSSKLFGNKTTKLLSDDDNFKRKIKEFRPAIVIHLASYLTSSDNLIEITKLIDTNITFLSKILDAISNVNLELFVNTGTFAEYYFGDKELMPSYFYAATKTASRAIVNYYANAYNFKQSTIVPYTIYGGNSSQKKIIDIIYESTFSEKPLNLSPGEQVLDFIHIEDVTNFYIAVIRNINRLPNKTNFNLGTGKGHSIKELARHIEQVTNRTTNICWGGKAYRKSDVMYAVANHDTIIENLNWSPKISLKEGIKKTFKKI